MSSLAAAAVAPPAGLPRIPCRGARNTARARPSLRARWGAVSVTNVLTSVPATTVTAEENHATRPLTAVIVGGGPGGIAACVALRRVGIDAVVYERAKGFNPNAGQGLTRRQLAVIVVIVVVFFPGQLIRWRDVPDACRLVGCRHSVAPPPPGLGGRLTSGREALRWSTHPWCGVILR